MDSARARSLEAELAGVELAGFAIERLLGFGNRLPFSKPAGAQTQQRSKSSIENSLSVMAEILSKRGFSES